MSFRVRFAPSPTGHLHVGNVRTALYNWLFARQHEGVFILRVEDTDLARSERQFEEQLIDDLKWLGLDWDEGVAAGGAHGPYRQTERFQLYQQRARLLLEKGLAYYCFCTPEDLDQKRQEQMAAGLQPLYSGRCRALDAREAEKRVADGAEAAIRLKVRPGRIAFEDIVFGPIAFESSVIGDFILMRSDGSPQYNFSVVVDDILMEISHVIRGEGHLSNTPRQILVYEALGAQPPRFAHLSTILGSDGSKLSKRHGATSIDEFRNRGYIPAGLLNYLALLGWAPEEEGREVLTMAELKDMFVLERVNKSPAVFDITKLNWVNRSHLKSLPEASLTELVLPFLQSAGWVPLSPEASQMDWIRGLAQLLLNYLEKGEDILEQARLFFEFDPAAAVRSPEVLEALSADGAAEVLRCFASELQKLQGPLDGEGFRAVMQNVKTVTGRKGKDLFHPVRASLTGRTTGPELDKTVVLLESGSRLGFPKTVASPGERVKAILEQLG